MITEKGHDALFQIAVDANPPATISWEFKGEPVTLDAMDDQSGRIVHQLEDGSLNITKAVLDDTGNWTVLADNKLGEVVRATISLEVTERIPVTV